MTISIYNRTAGDRKMTIQSNLKIRLADQNIEIVTDSGYLQKQCLSYVAEFDEPDFTVNITEEDLEFERQKHIERNGTDTPDREAVYESLAAYRKIAERMIDCDTLLFHGSAICADGQGYMFCAESGTGKSTHTRLWREHLTNHEIFMVNDDKPLIQIKDEVRVFGTPWSGKHHLETNTDVPLKAVCFLERGETNHIEKISADEALPQLIRYSYHSEIPERVKRSIGLLIEMMRTVSFYRLQCNMDPEAAEVSFCGMNPQAKEKERPKTFEEIIEKEGYLVYTCKGYSMMPLLRQHRDLVIISKIEKPLKKNDVVLFKRNGKYILHRIIKVKKDGYDTAGDHNWWFEKDVKRNEIIGILTSIVRDGKEIKEDDPKYKTYVRLWCGAWPLRMGILHANAAVRRAAHKLIRR